MTLDRGKLTIPGAGKIYRSLAIARFCRILGTLLSNGVPILNSLRISKDATGNNWLGIGYHFVIGNGHGMKDGSIDSTFRWKQQLHGAHSGSVPHNGFGIGICLIGNFENTAPTPKQTAAVTRLLRLLSVHYKLKREQVLGHKRIKPTACPGRLFPMRQIVDDAFPNSSQAKGVRSDSFRTSRSTHGS